MHGHASDCPAEEIREVSAEILSAARRLLRTTDNFLMYAQIETLSDSPLHIERMRQCTSVEPAGIMYDVVVQKALAHQRQQDVSMALDIEGVPIAIMEQHLDKITSELVENALYFSRPGTPVTVTATPSKSVFGLTSGNDGAYVFYPDSVVSSIENDDLGNEIQVSIYPNPSNHLFTIDLTGTGFNPAETIITLFDAQGKKIFERFPTNIHNQFSVEGLHKGLYLLHIDNQTTKAVRKLLVD
ncbi:MAG: T9SS type A sorting domain-containing protein [Ignavibacteria bacterium]|nr:T9SS type A sorting domain-containing protein [Ignavibacteria bacterium]